MATTAPLHIATSALLPIATSAPLPFATSTTFSIATSPTFPITSFTLLSIVFCFAYTAQIKINGQVVFAADPAVGAAIDFLYKAGYSGADGVFGKKQEPVCMQKSYEYLAYEDEDSDDDEKINADYERRKQRHQHRQKILKYVGKNIGDILKRKGEKKLSEEANVFIGYSVCLV